MFIISVINVSTKSKSKDGGGLIFLQKSKIETGGNRKKTF